MKTKFGAIIVDGRGKIGGHVASKNRAGSYLRTKVSPINKRSTDQLAVRNRFTAFSQGWKALTEAQRTAWNAAVTDYSKTDIFGDLKNPSGANLYQRLNNVLSQVGAAAITTPPIPSSVSNVVLASFIADVSDATMVCTFAPTVPANTAVIVKATAPISAGRIASKADFRTVKVLAAAVATGADISVQYIAKFGTITPAGAKIFVQFIPVNILTGQTGSRSQASAIIVA